MTSWRYLVVGEASTDLALRVLNLFAQQDLVVEGAALRRAGDRYEIRVVIHDLAPERAAIILEKMRAFVLVERADLCLADEERLAAAG